MTSCSHCGGEVEVSYTCMECGWEPALCKCKPLHQDRDRPTTEAERALDRFMDGEAP